MVTRYVPFMDLFGPYLQELKPNPLKAFQHTILTASCSSLHLAVTSAVGMNSRALRGRAGRAKLSGRGRTYSGMATMGRGHKAYLIFLDGLNAIR